MELNLHLNKYMEKLKTGTTDGQEAEATMKSFSEKTESAHQ